MKVFEVTTEHCEGDSKEIIKTVKYVTSKENTLKSVTDYFTSHCEQYEKDLMGVREVLVIVEHIDTNTLTSNRERMMRDKFVFPQSDDTYGSRLAIPKGGMTLREYFAAKAMQGLLANSFNDGISMPLSKATANEIARMAFEQADYMLEVNKEYGDR